MGSFFTYDINLKIKKFDVPPSLSEKKTRDFDQKHNRNQKMYQNFLSPSCLTSYTNNPIQGLSEAYLGPCQISMSYIMGVCRSPKYAPGCLLSNTA